jgi:hypothetical protein
MKDSTTKKPYGEWAMFVSKASEWLNKQGNTESKLSWAMKRMIDRVSDALKKEGVKYDNALEKLRITHCMEDEKGAVRINEITKGYEYSKTELLNLRNAQEKLYDKLIATEVEIECYRATEVPENIYNALTGSELDAFVGVVLDEQTPIPTEPDKAATVAQIQ